MDPPNSEILTSAQQQLLSETIRQDRAQEGAASNQDALIQQMNPQRQHSANFAASRREAWRRRLQVMKRFRAGRKIHRYVALAFRDLRLLHRQKTARALAMRMVLARTVRWMLGRRRAVFVVAIRVST